MTAQDTDALWMQRALELAGGVMNITSPNPRVGCVIVRDGRVLGEGATQRAGGPHAEVCALRDAAARGEDPAGSTFYVSLEPCSHHGRTPPCVDALIDARPARVVIAMLDPNPLVGGQGLARLRAAGIHVKVGVGLETALAQNVGFVARMVRKTPWLWLKLAGSLDGRSALHNGVSQWITGAAAREHGHRFRARACAVLTGVGTVLSDNPQLTPRGVDAQRIPYKIVLDTQLRTPPYARIFDEGEVWIVTASENAERTARLADRGARIVRLGEAHAGIDLKALTRWLGAQNLNEIHVEAGATLNGAFMREGVVDELVTYIAPMLLGDAAPMVRLPALDSLPASREFTFTGVEPVGEDLMLRARRPASWAPLLAAVQGERQS
ncbi:bifunctional diaminohydroxyphosphoribosylaminopyrimidine deaminase/5-amino-6-(5-phosphoribosylamino)uracil reductase RibD [Verticiella sediminum]|nr:bifunctional diaminohydroxyphosphoribosylaminopyrimidine deaminase/5-amino-6-(5-phosphoribosylamino)uracil reductase RibD [Verticiella sediminum]